MAEKLKEGTDNLTISETEDSLKKDDDDSLPVIITRARDRAKGSQKKDTESQVPDIKMITLDNLVPFKNHPFKLYEGQQHMDMVESIRANGVYSPIIVRRHTKEEGKYEILSGHNRFEAAKEAGLETLPAIVKEGLTEEEAMLVVTESNLIQRSFSDLKHSEKAIALSTHYEAIKKKSGYRSDLLDGIEELTSSPLAKRSTMDKLGEQHGLSKDTIARYLRVNLLVDDLKKRLDSGEIALRAAVTLSYLRADEQELVESFLAKGKKITIGQANALRKESEKKELNNTSIKKVFEPKSASEKTKPLKLSGQLRSQYFKEKQSEEDIEKIIADALEQYFQSRNS